MTENAESEIRLVSCPSDPFVCPVAFGPNPGWDPQVGGGEVALAVGTEGPETLFAVGTRKAIETLLSHSFPGEPFNLPASAKRLDPEKAKADFQRYEWLQRLNAQFGGYLVMRACDPQEFPGRSYSEARWLLAQTFDFPHEAQVAKIAELTGLKPEEIQPALERIEKKI